jgi:ligand-binding sensor domain-containing protein
MVVLPFVLFAQSSEWKQYFSSMNPVSSVFSGTDLWVGGKGLMKLETVSGAAVFYDISNSGLPSSRISALAVDSQNILWVGTDKGLAQFDGTHWTVYNKANSSLASDTIRSLLAGTSGDLWIGTANGLSRVNNGSWTIYNSSNSGFSSNTICALTMDPDTKTIHAFDGKGLVKFNGTSWTSTNANINNTFFASIASDGPATVWSVVAGVLWDTVYTEFGIVVTPVTGVMLMKFINGSMTQKQWLTGTATTAAVAVDNNHHLWIGTDRTLIKYDGTTFIPYTHDNSGLPSNKVTTISLDASGNPWIGTSDWYNTPTGTFSYGGITSYINGTWKTYSTSRNILGGDAVNDMLIDQNNVLWVGTGKTTGANGRAISGGLTRFDGASWTKWSSANSGLPNDIVTDISLQPNGTIITLSIPVTGSLNPSISRFNGVDWTQIPNSLGGRKATFLTTATDKDGSLWAGSYLENSLWKYTGTEWMEYNGVNTAGANSLFYDSAGRLWAASYSGIFQFNGTEWKKYDTTSAGLTFFAANKISEDASGNIWISEASISVNGKLYGNTIGKFTGSVWTSYTVPNIHISNGDILTAVIADAKGNVWVGTKGYGLKRLNGGVWKDFTTANSHLLSNTITALSIDKNGNLWIATDAGVCEYQEGGIIATAGYRFSGTPEGFALQQNFPNPFNPTTVIEYSVPHRSRIRLTVFDLLGRHCATLVNEIQDEGTYQRSFHAPQLPSGVYYYSLSADRYASVRKMLLIK